MVENTSQFKKSPQRKEPKQYDKPKTTEVIKKQKTPLTLNGISSFTYRDFGS
jgi:hypothetical protein